MSSCKDWEVEKVRDLLNSGLNYTKIAQLYKCNTGVVSYYCEKHNLNNGIKRKRTNMKQYKDKIIELANEGLKAQEIGDQLNISYTAIADLLKKNNVKYNMRETDNVEDYINDIIEDYQSGLTTKDIGKKYNFSASAICENLQKQGIDTSVNRRTYFVNESFFDKIETEEQAYIFGWFMSDGNVAKKGHLRIQIHHQDRLVLEQISKAMGYTGELKEILPRNTSEAQVCLSIHSKKLSDKLIALGCPPNKSLILEFPTTVPDELLHHFMRGYFDGDGSFCVRGASQYASITSNDLFIKVLQQKLHDLLGIDAKYYYRRKDKPTCTLHIGKTDDIKFFSDWLYKDATIYMSRKRDKILHLESF